MTRKHARYSDLTIYQTQRRVNKEHFSLQLAELGGDNWHFIEVMNARIDRHFDAWIYKKKF